MLLVSRMPLVDSMLDLQYLLNRFWMGLNTMAVAMADHVESAVQPAVIVARSMRRCPTDSCSLRQLTESTSQGTYHAASAELQAGPDALRSISMDP